MNLIKNTIAQVRRVIVGDANVSKFISNRLYPFAGKKGAEIPHGIISLNGVELDYSHSNSGDQWRLDLEVVCFSTDRSDSADLLEAVIRAVNSWSGDAPPSNFIHRVFISNAVMGDAILDKVKFATNDWIFPSVTNLRVRVD